jgi:hypothetical protein
VQEVYGKLEVKLGAKTDAGNRVLPLSPRLLARLDTMPRRAVSLPLRRGHDDGPVEL